MMKDHTVKLKNIDSKYLKKRILKMFQKQLFEKRIIYLRRKRKRFE